MSNKLPLFQFNIKEIFIVLALFCPVVLMGQDSATANNYWIKRNLPFAKQAVEEWCKNERWANSHCLLLTARIYNEIALSLQPDLVPDAAIEASKYLINAHQINRQIVNDELQAEGFALAKSIYSQITKKATEAYNAGIESKQKAHFLSSYSQFIRAQLFFEFSKAAKWGFPDYDTLLIVNLAKSTIKAGQEEPASNFARELIHRNIDSVQGEPIISIWKWTLFYYFTLKNEPSLVYLKEKFEGQFPNNSYASRIWINYKRELKERTEILLAYKSAIEKFKSDRALLLEARKYANYILKEQGTSAEQQSLARQIQRYR